MEDLLKQARELRAEIESLDWQINEEVRPPTGDDYNHLYVIANCGLIELLKAMGDTTDFGD